MGMKGVRHGLKGSFVRCEGCRMYLELDEARKVVGRGFVDWGKFRCEKCGEGSQCEEVVVRSEGVSDEIGEKEKGAETSVKARGTEEGQGGNTSDRGGSESGSVGGGSTLRFRRALVVGDSLVRNVDRAFCGGDRLHRTVACFPGARIEDIENRIDGMIRTRAEEEMVCIVQVGTNNIQKDSVGIIIDKYKKLFVHFRDRKDVRLVVSALLPRGRDESLHGKLGQVNRWLEGFCSENGVKFLSLWDRFSGNGLMYKRDLLHPSGLGSSLMGRAFEREVCETQGMFSGKVLN